MLAKLLIKSTEKYIHSPKEKCTEFFPPKILEEKKLIKNLVYIHVLPNLRQFHLLQLVLDNIVCVGLGCKRRHSKKKTSNNFAAVVVLEMESLDTKLINKFIVAFG